MNVRTPVDYSAMFTALDALMAVNLPQMELYCKIGWSGQQQTRERRCCRSVGAPAGCVS